MEEITERTPHRSAVSCPAWSCRRLVYLFLHSTLSTSRAVLAALQAADLGWHSGRDEPRTIKIVVPGR